MKKGKKRLLFAVSALLLCGSPLILTSCGDGVNGPVDVDPNDPSKVVSEFSVSLSNSKGEVSIGDTITITPKVVTPATATGQFTYAVKSGSETFISVNLNGVVTGLAEGEGTVIVTCTNGAEDLKPQEVTIKVLGEATNAVGAYNYVAESYEEKLNILGKMEEYAVDNHLTGITLFQNGGYVMYKSRIEKGTNTYIPGYGFGILSEGKITEPLAGETNANYKMYYHSYAGTTNKQKYNYLDDQGSESADLYGYVSSTYYGTKMNSSKDGYEYYPILAKKAPESAIAEYGLTETQANRPIALNKDEATGLATKYKVYVNTGKDGLKYSTLSTKYSSFDGREVQLEDYATPYMLLLNQKIGLARSADMISDSSNSTLKGARAYYNATKNNSNIEETAELFYDMVGLELNTEENSITFTFNTPVTEFVAMTNLSSTLTSPIPKEFVKAIAPDQSDENVYQSGMKNAYGTACTQTNTTPVDNLLSLAPYELEYSDSLTAVYKRNPDWIEFKSTDMSISSRYSIKGVVLVYLQGASSDVNLAFNTYLQDKLDAVSIPQDYLDQYKNNAETTQTQGDSTFKLNINSTTQDEWDSIFGKNGSNPNGGTTYNVKPLMSNDDFVNALSFSIDRKTFADARGNIPSQSYFAPAYLWEPEQGLSYDETEQHKAAIADYSPETYGYNVDVAVQLFDRAITEEINKGNYTGYNDSETIEISWMNTTDPKEYGNEILGYFNAAFQRTEAYKKGFRINFTQDEGSTDYQAVYTKMKKGTFDLGFGSISGMQLDPLGFLEVLKTNNETGFTLNYGIDTSVIHEDEENGYIVYDNKKWSFDSLWEAANKGAIVGTDTKVVEEPLAVKQAGTGTEPTTIEIGGKSVKARWLSLTYKKDLQAASTAMKFRTGDEESLVLSITYKNTEKEIVSTSFSIPYGNQFVIEDENEDYTISNDTSYINIYIPEEITNATTDGQIPTDEGFKYTDIQSISVNLNYYITINGVTTSQTLTISVTL